MPGSWQTSDRRDRLPPDWEKRRARRLRADNHKCQWRMTDGSRCGKFANEVDHVRPGDNHDDSNLQSLCSWHHSRKSSGEGNAALAKQRREVAGRFRRQEEHPGML